MHTELVLAPGVEIREVGSEVDQACGLGGVRPVLALIEADRADARAQGESDGPPEVEERAAREKALGL
eukprot:2427273-Alexandrium_andersonii.AAC.1